MLSSVVLSGKQNRNWRRKRIRKYSNLKITIQLSNNRDEKEVG